MPCSILQVVIEITIRRWAWLGPWHPSSPAANRDNWIARYLASARQTACLSPASSIGPAFFPIRPAVSPVPMAISSTFSSLRSTKRPAASSTIQNQAGGPAQTAPPTTQADLDKDTLSIMAFTESSQAKKLDKKNKLRFFRRLSTRFSSKQNSAAPPIDPTLTASSDPTPNLSKSRSNDPTVARASPGSDLSLQIPFESFPKTSPSLSCDETGSLYRAEEAGGLSVAAPGSLKSPSRASRSFWKRLSLSPSLLLHADDEQLAGGAGAVPPATEMASSRLASPVEDLSVSSDGHPSSIMSSELSSTPSSANETYDTSLASAYEAETEECGLAGIGVRDRRSICLYSLPIRPSLSCSPSRPISSLAQNDRRMSFGHLNLVPNQTTVDTETLMRILRGPSSYPDETLPRPDSRRDSIYVPCV
ncbi:hypothetical protein PtB15_7B84 [Puccinia triticina]|nr:hypothetical protein PtB15_7B84 [Puccinia triticina]